jgi:Flp pilus assembly pilin Flp
MLAYLLHNPQADYLRALTGIRISRFQQAARERDTGASAIELAIITAVIVGLAIGVLLIVGNVVRNRTTEINTNNGQIP